MVTWERPAADLVVGTFAGHEIDFLRTETMAMQDVWCDRLRQAPTAFPFGSTVQCMATLSPPEDVWLLLHLHAFIGSDEPEWVWCWHELDLWEMLGKSSAVLLELLPETGDGQLEIRTIWQLNAVITTLKARGVVLAWFAENLDDPQMRQHHGELNQWMLATLDELVRVSSEPEPLPQ